MMELNLFKTDI